jgi:dTMP kinase
LVLEGGEGTGKSTQAALLARALGATLTREPGGTPTGEQLRAVLLDPSLPPVAPRAEALMLLAARAQHVAEVIEPGLAAGHDVVCDRFSGSTLAYQGYGRGLPVDELAQLSAWACAGVAPDRVILLAVPPDVAAERLSRRGRRDRMEAAADPEAWRVVDGAGSIQEVAARVAEAAQP